MLLARARKEVDSVRVWLKSVQFERVNGSLSDGLALVQEALGRFPKADKLHMVHGQLHEQLAEAAGIARTLGALIDGVYLRAALSDDIDAHAAETLILDYLGKVLP